MTKSDVVKNNSNVDKTLKYLALFSVCLYIVISTIFDSIKTNLAVLSSLSIYFCLGCCVLYILNRGTFKLGRYEIWMLVLVALVAISILYTPTDERLVNMYFHRFYTSAILVLVVSNTVCDEKDAMLIVDAYILAGLLLALYIYSTYGFSNLAADSERIDSKLGNQNGTGMSCAYAICFSIYRLVTTNKKRALFYIATVVACTPVVMFTGSRKALLIMLCAIFVFAFCYSKNKLVFTRILWVVVIAAIIFAIIYYVPAFGVIKERVLSTIEVFQGSTDAETSKSDATRMKYVTKGLQFFLESPIWGNGFQYSYHRFGTYSHCNYVELLMNGGIIFFCVYYYLYVVIISHARKLLKNDKSRKYGAFQIMLMVAFLTMDIGVVSFYDRYTLIMLTLCMRSCAADEPPALSEAENV